MMQASLHLSSDINTCRKLPLSPELQSLATKNSIVPSQGPVALLQGGRGLVAQQILHHGAATFWWQLQKLPYDLQGRRPIFQQFTPQAKSFGTFFVTVFVSIRWTLDPSQHEDMQSSEQPPQKPHQTTSGASAEAPNRPPATGASGLLKEVPTIPSKGSRGGPKI